MTDQVSKNNQDPAEQQNTSNEDIVNSLVTDFTNKYSLSEENSQCVEKEDFQNKVLSETVINSEEKYLDDDSIDKCLDEDSKENSDDDIDEVELGELEKNLSDEELINKNKEAEKIKLDGNEKFKSEKYEESKILYTEALKVCPLKFAKERSILHSNRAAAKLKLDMKESALKDCTKAIELDERYKKAIVRRAQIYESLEKLDEALADYKKAFDLDPNDRQLLYTCSNISEAIEQRDKKLKAEMMEQLKNLGNMVLKPFGLSTNNFQMVQDPNTGGYSINFNQNANS
uniref:Uncharacterized protein n=1 Tax=Clastoptera arizonana TaxID=38151 RepID=A0A1B6CG96_9HEMI